MNRAVVTAVSLILFSGVAQAKPPSVRESLEIAWESLWFQAGFPMPVTRWQAPIRVKFTGSGVRWHRGFALRQLRQVADAAGVEIAEVAADSASANLEVEFVNSMSLSGRTVCATEYKLTPAGAIASARIRADTDFVRGCMLHEAMHAMGIRGHPRSNSVLSYFRRSNDELTETDRFLLRTHYSIEMTPGTLPFSALSVYARALTDAVEDEKTRDEARQTAQSFLQETMAQMESFANGTGEPPRIVFRSSTSTSPGVQRGRVEMMYLLGHAYTYGTIVKQDQKKAIDLLCRAAAAGHEEAESLLMTAHASEAFRPTAGNPAAFFVRGRFYGKNGDYERALADFDTSISLKPDDARTLWYRGNAHEKLRDYDRAIADFTEVIRLNGEDIGALRSRAYAYRRKGDYERAQADFDHAVRIDPNDSMSLHLRGMMYREKGDYGLAMADLNEAIRLQPDYAAATFERGYVNYARGEFRSAAADFKRGSELRPRHVYAALWQYLAAQRAGHDGGPALQRYAARLDSKNWPAPVVPLYLGGSSPDGVLAAADHSDPKKAAEQKCEARFYIGQYLLLKGDRAGSIDLLTDATNTCPREFYEYGIAKVELRRSGIEPDRTRYVLRQ